MAFNFWKFVSGINIVPKTPSTANSMGDLDVDSSTGRLHYHDGSVNDLVVTRTSTDTLTNKTIVGATFVVTTTPIEFQETGGGTDTISLSAPPSIPASYALLLPTDAGTSGYSLVTNGSGTLSWAAPGSGGNIGSAIGGALQGSVLFAGPGGILAQDNSSFFFDDSTNQLEMASGTAVNPSYSFFGDSNTGIYRSGADTLNISTGGTSRIQVGSTGTITIPGLAVANGVVGTDGSGNLSSALLVNARVSPSAAIDFSKLNTTLTVDTDFGGSFSLVGIFKTRSSNPATTGTLRLGNTDAVAWRNQANSADLILEANALNRLTYAGDNIITATSTDTLTNKTLTAPTITSAGISGGTLTSVGIDADMNTITNIDNNEIKAGANISRSKLADYQAFVTSSSGGFSTTSTSFTDVTNLSQSVTTLGDPVCIELIADGSTLVTSPSIFSASGGGTAYYAILRDSTIIGLTAVLDGQTTPASSFRMWDTPGAGTYTYKLQTRGTAGSTSQVLFSKLRVSTDM